MKCGDVISSVPHPWDSMYIRCQEEKGVEGGDRGGGGRLLSGEGRMWRLMKGFV